MDFENYERGINPIAIVRIDSIDDASQVLRGMRKVRNHNDGRGEGRGEIRSIAEFDHMVKTSIIDGKSRKSEQSILALIDLDDKSRQSKVGKKMNNVKTKKSGSNSVVDLSSDEDDCYDDDDRAFSNRERKGSVDSSKPKSKYSKKSVSNDTGDRSVSSTVRAKDDDFLAGDSDDDVCVNVSNHMYVYIHIHIPYIMYSLRPPYTGR